MRVALLFASICMLLFVGCFASPKTRILMIVDNNNLKTSHSLFIKMVKDLGNVELTIKEAKDRSLELFSYGEPLFEHLILLAPSLDLSMTKLDTDAVLQFIDIGRNIFFAVDESISKDLREVASECGVVFDESGTKVIDHFNQLKDDSADGAIFTEEIRPLASFFSAQTLAQKRILYDGIAHRSESKIQKLNIDLLTGSSYSYSFSPSKDVGENSRVFASGKSTVLVSALQARNNARVVFSGSLKMLSDSFFLRSSQGKKFANQAFVSDLLHWNFQLKSVLRIASLNHHPDYQSGPPSTYVIKEHLSYSVVIEELSNGKWVPYSADDVQLEFQMLDPYVRTHLTSDQKGNFTVRFLIPDVYGVFTLKLEYQRPGYSHLFQNTIVPVRPLKHNEYERFIVAAYPYYAGSASMLFGAVFLAIIFLLADTRS